MINTDMSIQWHTEEVNAKVREAIGLAMVNAGGKIVEFAKVLTPYKRGHNRRLITFDTKPINDGKTVLIRVYTQSGYGGWLEVGTTKMRPRPYIKPAIGMAKPSIREDTVNIMARVQ